MISETKLYSSFTEGQFLIPGYGALYIIDRNCHGGGFMLLITKNIPSKLLSAEYSSIKGFYIELNLREKKWLLCDSYNLHTNTYFLNKYF